LSRNSDSANGLSRRDSTNDSPAKPSRRFRFSAVTRNTLPALSRTSAAAVDRLDRVDYPDSPDVAYTYGAPGASANRANRIVTVTVDGVGACGPEHPQHNLTGDPYFTDGKRAVIALSQARTTPQYIAWA
jgi:hypothetical protein